MKNGGPPVEAVRTQHKIAYVALAVVLCAAVAGFWGARMTLTGKRSPVHQFWRPFFAGNDSLVVYGNTDFVGNPATGLRDAPTVTRPTAGARPGIDGVNTYTGVGEVNGVYELTRLFDHYHAYFTLKRSRLVNWEEARFRSLVIIGSAAEDAASRVLPANMDFTFAAGNGTPAVVNHDPQPGEQAIYSHSEQPLTRDYSVIALLPGHAPGSRILVLSGLTTLGTQAAVDFVCRRESVAQILGRAAGPHYAVKPFQAVIETKLAGGVPLESRLVAIHVH